MNFVLRLLPKTLTSRVYALYSVTLVLFVSIGLTVFYRYALIRQVDEVQQSAVMLIEVAAQSVQDSAVIGDYDTVRKTLEKAVAESQFKSASFIDLQGGIIKLQSPEQFDHQPPGWLHDAVAERLYDVNRTISVGGRDYGILRLTYDSQQIAARIWELINLALAMALATLIGGLLLIRIPLVRWLGHIDRLRAFEEDIRSGAIDPQELLSDDAPLEIRQMFEVINRTASRLQVQREQAAVTLNAIADGVLTVNPQGTITYANPAATSMFGQTRDELHDQRLQILLPGILPDELTRDLRWSSRRIELNAAEGRMLVLDATLSPIIDPRGQYSGHVLACRDVTTAHALEQQLRTEFAAREGALKSLRDILHGAPVDSGDTLDAVEDLPRLSRQVAELVRDREASHEAMQKARDSAEAASRAKSEFLANMSHEIRTPMNGILGMTELALETQLTGEQREYINIVRTSAESLLVIINDILDFSKIEAGKLSIEHIPFHLPSLLTDTLKPLAMRAQDKGLSLRLSPLPVLPPHVEGDPGRLRQVLINLIGNAIKFTERGTITVGVSIENQQDGRMVLHMAVHDTGVGIAPDKQRYIFEAFAQEDGSVTRRYGGTGLGLTISSRLVELMGGHIWLESEPGVGSTFHFTVTLGYTPAVAQPVTRTDGAAAPTAHIAATDTGRPTQPTPNEDAGSAPPVHILLVEDNPINQKLAINVLKRLGYQATLAENGLEAVELCRQRRFDVILMDMQMPVMDGLEATEQIRAHELTGMLPRTPIIAVTANAMENDRTACLAAGMDDYISKPFKTRDLEDKLAHYLH